MGQLTLVERTKLNLAGVTVLVAGGAAMATDVLVSILSGFGAGQLRRAETLDEARERFLEAPVDLIVLDSTLGRDGCAQLTLWLRRMQSDSRLCPVLLVAANPLNQDIGTARDSGVNYVVAKPVTPKVLFERLVWIVREQRPFVECERYAGPDRRWRPPDPPRGSPGRRSCDSILEVDDTMPSPPEGDPAMMSAGGPL